MRQTASPSDSPPGPPSCGLGGLRHAGIGPSMATGDKYQADYEETLAATHVQAVYGGTGRRDRGCLKRRAVRLRVAEPGSGGCRI